MAAELAPLPTYLVDTMDSLDDAIHQKARMGIMSTLVALGEADFKLLKESLGLSDGNLSTHLVLLENRGYVLVQKEFRGKRPHTSVALTDLGREAFADYISSLERIVKGMRE